MTAALTAALDAIAARLNPPGSRGPFLWPCPSCERVVEWHWRRPVDDTGTAYTIRCDCERTTP